jgi:hypothetical protein
VRDDLGVRTTAQFLIAVAACEPGCRPFLRRYLGSRRGPLRLPSDWLGVPAMYRAVCGLAAGTGGDAEGAGVAPSAKSAGTSAAGLPTALRKALAARFGGYDAYQLAKYDKARNLLRRARRDRERAAREAAAPTPVVARGGGGGRGGRGGRGGYVWQNGILRDIGEIGDIIKFLFCPLSDLCWPVPCASVVLR